MNDCQSAIKRFRHAANPLGSAVGHRQYGQVLGAIRALITKYAHSVTWTKAHPERTKQEYDWSADDRGIHMADLIAGCSTDIPVPGFTYTSVTRKLSSEQ